jgi:uncharacterized coiled-coil protein SlyX
VATEGYVTYKEMTASQQGIKKELLEIIDKGEKKMDKLEDKVTNVTEKVGHLNDIVLPLTVVMQQTADNTKEMSQTLKEFTKSQSMTNELFNDKISAQNVTIEGIKNVTNTITEKKKYNVTVVVALIGLIGVFITGLFQLAPILFQN